MSVPPAESIRATVLRVLGEIAPEADLARIEPERAFREQLDLDSMDFLNFVIGLHHALHVDIPESDYPKLTTLRDCVRYLTALAAAEGTRSGEGRPSP